MRMGKRHVHAMARGCRAVIVGEDGPREDAPRDDADDHTRSPGPGRDAEFGGRTSAVPAEPPDRADHDRDRGRKTDEGVRGSSSRWACREWTRSGGRGRGRHGRFKRRLSGEPWAATDRSLSGCTRITHSIAAMEKEYGGTLRGMNHDNGGDATVLNAMSPTSSMMHACLTPDFIEDSPICPAIRPEKKPMIRTAW